MRQLVILGGVMPALLYFVNVVSDAGALMIVRGADFLSVFDKPQRDALAMLFLRLHGHQNTAAETLWGLWLLPLAILVYRSRFLPRFLGVWLAINGFAYVIISFTGLLLPQYADKVFIFSQPALFGEMAFMLWLVIKGTKPPALDAAASSSALLRLHCGRTEKSGVALGVPGRILEKVNLLLPVCPSSRLNR